jgi:FlaA1/EpsC-like NDP-sugar epimerase
LKNFLDLNGFKPVNWGEKTIPASSDKPYPAIFCFAKVDTKATGIVKDKTLTSSIETYIQRSRKILDEIDTRITSALTKNRRIIVWGTGQLVMKLLVETALADAEIIAFVDNNPINQGKKLRGVNILAPDQIDRYSEPILVSSTLHQQAIVEQISEMGIKNPLILLK